MKKFVRLTVFILLATAFTFLFLFTGCTGKDAAPKEGYTLVTFRYEGADGYDEDATEYVLKGDAVELPALQKEGYAFIGWECDDGYTVRDSIPTGERDKLTLKAVFEEDYTGFTEPCYLYFGGTYNAYAGKAYPKIAKRVSNVYVNGGYKVIVYSRANFKGNTNTLTYKCSYNGYVGSMEIVKIQTEERTYDELTGDVKAELLYRYAPRLYWASGESYFACDVDAAVNYLTREKSAGGYYFEIPGITDPDFENAFLHGDLATAKAYGFAVEKEGRYLDLGYYVYCPYNKGKKVLWTYYGNHVGDWEHMTVRLLVEDKDGKKVVSPVLVEYSTHSFRFYVPFDKAKKAENTHPIGYIARESHGIWKDAGSHAYIVRAVFRLKDFCDRGTAWDLWQENRLETYAYDARTWQGEGIGASVWKTCFDKDYYNPASNSVYRWGNQALPDGILYERFSAGPTGPQEKSVLSNYYTIDGVQKL